MKMARTYKLGPDVDLDMEVIRDAKGRRITEKKAEDIAEQTLEKVGRGRPSLTGARTRSPQVSFRAPGELRAQAEARAAREGKTVSQLAREALERLLAG
jgi:predicted HicB family RNase H-like nuclease